MEVEKESSFWYFQGKLDYVDKWFLMGSPYPVLAILLSYLYFVLKCGPKFMKDRPPFKLRKTIIFYNAIQVLCSLYMFQLGLRNIYRYGMIENGICNTDDPQRMKILVGGHHLYFLCKLTELLDTVFFVLRKKWIQISFLHVYHHALMFSLTWTVLKYEPTYSFVLIGTINCLVHVIMYTYYALSAFPKLQKYLWWKKYLTTMQLVQFMLAFVQISWNAYVTTCRPSYILLGIAWSHLILFLYLFMEFYIKSYTQKEKEDDGKRSKVDARTLKDTNGNRNFIDKSRQRIEPDLSKTVNE